MEGCSIWITREVLAQMLSHEHVFVGLRREVVVRAVRKVAVRGGVRIRGPLIGTFSRAWTPTETLRFPQKFFAGDVNLNLQVSLHTVFLHSWVK